VPTMEVPDSLPTSFVDSVPTPSPQRSSSLAFLELRCAAAADSKRDALQWDGLTREGGPTDARPLRRLSTALLHSTNLGPWPQPSRAPSSSPAHQHAPAETTARELAVAGGSQAKGLGFRVQCRRGPHCSRLQQDP
jgi:hypothetical protein